MCSACGFPAAPGHWTEAGANTAPDRLRARFRDGTLISLPEEGDLPALDLKPALERNPSVTVLLALPTLHLGRANVSEARTDSARFTLDSQELEDENTGVNPQLIPVRMPNLQLLLSSQDQAGFEVLPLARIDKSIRADALPQLDEAYIPPVLAADVRTCGIPSSCRWASIASQSSTSMAKWLERTVVGFGVSVK